MKNKLIYEYKYMEELNYDFTYCIYFNSWREELEYSLYCANTNNGTDKKELLFQVTKKEFYNKVDSLIKDVLLAEIIARVENKLEELELSDKFKVYPLTKGIGINDKEFRLNESHCWIYESLLNEVLNYIDTLNTK